jgi:hypothetical protein
MLVDIKKGMKERYQQSGSKYEFKLWLENSLTESAL